jgi:hypothetical protein
MYLPLSKMGHHLSIQVMMFAAAPVAVSPAEKPRKSDPNANTVPIVQGGEDPTAVDKRNTVKAVRP